jgi:hypothetical protein
MKNMFIVALSILSSACGKHVTCDFFVYGACVSIQDYPVTEEMVQQALDMTEASVNEVYPGLNMVEYIQAHPLTIEAVDSEEIPGLRGRNILNNIKVHYINESAENNCMEFVYVLGHELLHYVAQHHIYTTVRLNQQHMVPYLFVDWCLSNMMHSRSCAEHDVWMDSKDYCGF